MLRKIIFLCVAMLALFVFCAGSAFASPLKSYVADQFAVSANIAPGGTMLVTETITFHFTGGPFSFVTRELPTDNTDGVFILSARMDDQAMSQGSAPGQYELTDGNPEKITWHFSQQFDSSHTFMMAYRMQGVIQQSTDDLLDWKPLPDKHDYTIGAANVTINYPVMTSFSHAPEVAQGTATVAQTAGQVVLQAHDLGTDEHLELGLHFRSGSLVHNAPHWQQAQMQARAVLPYFLGAGSLIFLLGSFLLIRYYRRYRRKTAVGAFAALEITAPPDDIAPAIAGVLATTTDGSPTWDHALGTLFDLMERGVVTITPPLLGGWNAWFDGHPDFQLVLLSMPPDLRLHEAGLLKIFFQSQQGVRPVVNISRIGGLYRGHSALFSKPLKLEMTAMGFFEPTRQRIRRRLGCTSLVVFLLSLVVAFVAVAAGPWPIIFVPLGVAAVCITAFFLWGGFSTYSDDAMQVKSRWDAFAGFLGILADSDQPLIGPELFARYLPYAASFSLLIPWARALQQQGMLALPHWFKTLALAANIHNAGDTERGFFGMMETTHELTHKSESNSSNSGSNVSGSSGAAGGGSSSAG